MNVTLDMFPVDLFDGERVLPKARLILTDDRVMVFAEVDNRPVLWKAANLEGTPMPGHLTAIDTTAGRWSVTRTGGCGCGALLRRIPLHELLALADG